ncbi:hypothetical protein Bbelb_192010 [Branchiostoma belcheri]|nr:hypothetical protein Bbelb_192010 [Branchiostoma belcheri]
MAEITHMLRPGVLQDFLRSHAWQAMSECTDGSVWLKIRTCTAALASSMHANAHLCDSRKELANHIKAAVPDAEVMGVVGRSSSFEITVDGQLLFSKLESGGFPEEKEILEALSNYKEGDKVEQVTNIQFPANRDAANGMFPPIRLQLITQPMRSDVSLTNQSAARSRWTNQSLA